MNTKEEILFNLPDYIEGTLNDQEAIKQIENELQNNEAFKAEYNEMRETILFLKASPEEAPSESYFNNLLPRINERISQKENVSGESLLQKILSYWKILVPVIPLVIIFFLYRTYFMNPGIELPKKKDSTEQIQPTVEEKTGKTVETVTNEEADTAPENNLNGTPTVKPQNSNVKIKKEYAPTVNETVESVPVTQTQVEEALENSPYVEESEDEFTEFDQLDADQQNEILTKLENTDF